jgi:hypothetical protein
MEPNSNSSKKLEEAFRQSLSQGPKRAKELVQEVSKVTGKKESTIFYWLKKLQDSGKILKIEEKYHWVGLEEAEREEVRFCLDMLEKGTPEQVESAKKDFLHLSRTRKIGHLPEVQDLLEKALVEYHGEDLEWALEVMNFMIRLSKAARDMRVLKWMKEQEKKLLELAKDERREDNIREKALWVLDEVLEGEDHLEAFWEMLETSIRKRAKKSRAFSDRIWRLLLRKHFPERKMEMRKRLYALLGPEEEMEVRGLASQYLDDLRLKEYMPEGEK